MSKNAVTVHEQHAEPWRITLVDTGEHSLTGGRLKRVAPYLDKNEPFCFTYGDGVSDIDISAKIAFHREHGKLATVTAVRPPSRFGGLALENGRVAHFEEKPQIGEGWINGGYFVLQPKVLDYISGDDVLWERGPLETLAAMNQLHAYRHEGFWQPMDTVRDRSLLESLWQSGNAPWKVWE
jgi:glucose-1-phosphate cytidylyltransferase